ncbi:MAG TPA: response regulator [Polyangia bacterium]
MPSSLPSSERRCSPRASLTSRAVVRRQQESLGTFEVLNLAAGGLLLAGDPPEAGSGIAPDETVDVVLDLAAGDPLILPGHLMGARKTRHGSAFVFAFSALPAGVRAQLQTRIDDNVARAQAARVLVVDDSREIGDALCFQLDRLGQAAHAVTTPLEALRLLEEPNQVQVAIVDMVLGGANGLDLLAYLSDQHPNIRRVLMSGHAAAGQLELTARGHQAMPHEVLAKPWSETTLTRALGVIKK